MTLDIVRSGLIDVPHGFFGRKGGVSVGAVAGLNCGLGSGDDRHQHRAAQRALADAALEAVAEAQGRVAQEVRRQFEIDRAAIDGGDGCTDFDARQRLKLEAIAAQRVRLRQLRDADAIGAEAFERLQEALDWHELAIGPADRRTMEEG